MYFLGRLSTQGAHAQGIPMDFLESQTRSVCLGHQVLVRSLKDLDATCQANLGVVLSAVFLGAFLLQWGFFPTQPNDFTIKTN